MDKLSSRKEEILEAAVYVFAYKGYFKATTADVAKHAKISQPYVYNFYKSKEELLLAALDRAMDRIVTAFSNITGDSATIEAAMITSYEGLMNTHKEEILLQVQALAIREPAVQDLMQQGLCRIKDYALHKFREAGIQDCEQRAADFMARGMLCNVALALDSKELTPRGIAEKKNGA
ncbi:TetR/AcrR family transcriptional regulator [Paenibacillus mendelii]|uniref:TetR/AcrR family transcriptional regulator n=1 Tax=Paenibacillus mendelii TaxID=206163 RepID=A0ABV6J6W2_9BACL|nr:TetR/AcrR family transcriptional regulator [Paenibacillus mendelii]MCQ6561001.1 TetR/AcrR family transcriptional regulator [Paenibacillus mendelii]